MSTSSLIIKRIENAVYHQPHMIPILFKEGKIKAGFLHSRLRRYVPHRVGIEFECFGDFANQYLKANNLRWKNWTTFEDQFHILDFSQDTNLFSNRDWQNSKEPSITTTEEVRVSISDYRQLSGLYDILNEMGKYCSISEDCGIHIHIDLTKYGDYKRKKAAVNWFNRHLTDVESIFPEYKGNYNRRIAQQGKGSWVNLSNKDTVEFRIAPLTFDYELLITWIVKCSKLVSRMVCECQLNRNLDTRIGKSIITPRESRYDYDLIPETDAISDSVMSENNLYNAEISTELLNNRLFRYLREGHEETINSILNMIAADCHREDIDFMLDGSDIVLIYPDGGRARSSRITACICFLDGGLTQVINHAVSEEPYTSINGWTIQTLNSTYSSSAYWTPGHLDTNNYIPY